MAGATQRLDAFTDAAFAFALSLLVVGQGRIPTDLAELRAELADVPAFAIGFGVIAMFWYTHVRWRDLRGRGGALSVLLTIALIFLVLVYVKPLQAMALSLSTFLGGSGTRFKGDVGALFFIYSGGFALMSALVAALFVDAARAADQPDYSRSAARGEGGIWCLLALTGLASMALAVSPWRFFSPYVYLSLWITIPIYVWRYPWPRPPA
jgi:uncharacterized membrane protein